MLPVYATMGDFARLFPDSVISDKELRKASRDVDVLTFNKIHTVGIEHLTEYQQETIKEVVCEHASFLSENEDMLETYLSSYSINGVSMGFEDSWNLKIQDGIAIKQSLYRRLVSTNLCWRGGI